jgi:leader peptidase (prepilin peptidase)/N-methyltransferase
MVVEPPGGFSRAKRRLWCPHADAGDVVGEEETGLGVPLIPDRAATRSTTTRWPNDAHRATRPLLFGSAALAVIALAVAAAVGTAPVAGAIGVAMLVPAAVIDIEQRRLPDAWVVAGAVAVIVTLVVDSVVGQPHDTGVPASVALGAFAMALPVLALHLVSPASMGFGDVKAAVVLGAAVGTADARLAAVALCLAAAGGAAVGLATRQRTIPFGPFLVVASLLVLLAHDPIVATIFAGGDPS